MNYLATNKVSISNINSIDRGIVMIFRLVYVLL